MKPIELAERLGRWSSGRGPLQVLLAARLRLLIDEGELPPGESLPPDRALALALAVGRSTVVAAYDLLRQDGRIIRRQGSGTRVAGAQPAGAEPAGARQTTSAPLFLHLLEPGDGVIPLACAAPDTPPPEVAEAYAGVAAALASTAGDIGYYPAGHPSLRRAIADRYTGRGIRTGPEQIVVTNGGQQALSLLARALLAPGDRVLVEGPTYPGALEAFREQAAVPVSLPVGLGDLHQPGVTGGHGRPDRRADPDAVAARGPRAAMAYVISTFHNPTGSVLPSLARQALVQAAAAAGVSLVDDEVLADLGFPGTQVPPPLASYDSAVISVGSISKNVWGGLRIGWVRAAEPLIARLARLLAVHDLGGNVPAQLAAADLLPRLDALSLRQAPVRQARHDHLRAVLARRLPDWDAPAVPGGQTLWVRLPYGDGTSFAQTALRHGIAVLPGSGLDASGRCQDHLRLHFVAPPETLTEAVRRLAEAWRAYHPPPTPATAPPAMSL
jgi:DNA-binding transcriptional MocR family regulator